jgi:hypothetical protein
MKPFLINDIKQNTVILIYISVFLENSL